MGIPGLMIVPVRAAARCVFLVSQVPIMSLQPTAPNGAPITEAADRAQFIRRTYFHLAAALGAFALLSAFFLSSGLSLKVARLVANSGQFGWLIVLGAFILVGRMASNMADNASPQTQLMGLGLYVLIEAVIFMPLLAIAQLVDPTIIPTAGMLTGLLVGGITFTAFTTRKNFSFLAPILSIAGLIALGVIVASVLFGFTLGLMFSAAMIVLAGGMILFDTSRIIHDYPTDRPAGAALHLFASVALLLWYVINLLLKLRR
jgi:uncharacterized protein